MQDGVRGTQQGSGVPKGAPWCRGEQMSRCEQWDSQERMGREGGGLPVTAPLQLKPPLVAARLPAPRPELWVPGLCTVRGCRVGGFRRHCFPGSSHPKFGLYGAG